MSADIPDASQELLSAITKTKTPEISTRSGDQRARRLACKRQEDQVGVEEPGTEGVRVWVRNAHLLNGRKSREYWEFMVANGVPICSGEALTQSDAIVSQTTAQGKQPSPMESALFLLRAGSVKALQAVARQCFSR